MKLHLNNQPNCLLVHSCVLADDGADANPAPRHRIKIADEWYRRSVIVAPEAVALWEVAAVTELTAAHFDHLAGLGAEVVLLGTGARIAFVDAALTRALMRQRIGLEVMDTAAACRTYNILAADGRKVVAALIV